jgi:hypothetical protein
MDGSRSALSELSVEFPDHVRLNRAWNVIEIVGCLTNRSVFGTIPAETVPDIAAALAE